MSIWATIEIPAGLRNKYELDANGNLFLDCVAVVPFPANYGSVAGTLAEDNDELDVLVVTDEPLVALSKVNIRPIAVLKMIDDGELDYKLVAVPVNDYTKNHMLSVNDFGSDFEEKIQIFFQTIKDATNTPVRFEGWGGKEEAEKIIAAAQERFKQNG